MGFADLLKKKGVEYSSDEALEIAETLGNILQKEATQATEDLAQERGSFTLPGCNFEFSRRNLTTTCIAPTGGICLLTGNKGFAVEPYFSESTEIPAAHHIRVQAVWQRHIENCISKTIGFKNNCTPKEIANALKFAHQRGCKGITAFRDGSRDEKTPITYCPDCAHFPRKKREK